MFGLVWCGLKAVYTLLVYAVITDSVLTFLGFKFTRRLYVFGLHKLFEYANRELDRAKRKLRKNYSSLQDEEEVIPQSAKTGLKLIERDVVWGPTPEFTRRKTAAACENQGIHDVTLETLRTGVEAIVQDELMTVYDSQTLPFWNLLTRNIKTAELLDLSWKVTTLYVLGLFFRYCVLFPIRIALLPITLLFLTISTTVVGLIPPGPFQRKASHFASTLSFGLLLVCFGMGASYQDLKYRPARSGIAIANHTTPVDVALLMGNRRFSMIGQKHQGIIGIFETCLEKVTPQIWFDRAEVKDRSVVSQRLKDHITLDYNPPIIVFPEGTCVNNTAIVQFKKGSFEIGDCVHPIAIKYDARTADPFWNTSRQTAFRYILSIISSWGMMATVTYLPPVRKLPGEGAVEFGARAKAKIAEIAGFKDLPWDGLLKRQSVRPEWLEAHQEELAKQIKTIYKFI